MNKKISDALFSARWAIRAGKPDFAYDKVTEALEEIGALPKSIKDQEPPPMSELPKEALEDDGEEIQDPIFVKLKDVHYKETRYNTKSKMAEGLVVHYTVSGRSSKNAIGVLKYLASQNLGCMVMDEDGIIYVPESFDVMRDAAAHAGVSKWNGHSGLNDEFAGIEICGWGRSNTKDEPKGRTVEVPKQNENMFKGWYQPFTPKQEKALKNLCYWMKKQNPSFKFENVCGHDEARIEAGKPGDKQDPGGSLSMTMPSFRKNVLKI